MLALLAALACALCAAPTRAQDAEPPAAAEAPADPLEPTEPETTAEPEQRSSPQDAVVAFADSIRLGKNESANAVVGVFSSVESDGDVRDAVVAVFGDARVSGSVGDAAGAIFGDAYIDAHVRGDVFTVFGNLELGPNAQIDGHATAIGGNLLRHPAAIVRGGTTHVELWGLRSWFQNAFMLGRPLAIAPELGWAWAIALGFLAFYVLLGLMFSRAVEKCVDTLERRPGESTLAALATVFLTPMAMFILLVTVIGMALIPFLMMALFIAGLFGKAVVLGALGRRITRFATSGFMSHIAFAIFIGGLLITALYLVPFFGFLIRTLVSILGVGVVVYTMLLVMRANRAQAVPTAPTAAPGAAPGGASLGGLPAAAATQASPEPAAPENLRVESAPVDVTTLPRAGFGVRMGALFIDAVLVAIVTNVIPGSGDIWLLALATYGAIMWKLKGTTVGGIICNLKVVRLDGQEMDWATTIVRALGCFLSMIAAGLGFFWIAFDSERQGWHDKIAGTVVVRPPKPSSLV